MNASQAQNLADRLSSGQVVIFVSNGAHWRVALPMSRPGITRSGTQPGRYDTMLRVMRAASPHRAPVNKPRTPSPKKPPPGNKPRTRTPSPKTPSRSPPPINIELEALKRLVNSMTPAPRSPTSRSKSPKRQSVINNKTLNNNLTNNEKRELKRLVNSMTLAPRAIKRHSNVKRPSEEARLQFVIDRLTNLNRLDKKTQTQTNEETRLRQKLNKMLSSSTSQN
jgi:hypothetical protein